jgi:hypothetical protein
MPRLSSNRSQRTEELMNEQGLSRDSLRTSLSIVLPRFALLATALSLSLGLAGSCAPATDGPSGTAGSGGAGTTGAGGITMTAGTTGTAGATGAAGSACQGPPMLKLAWSIAIDKTTTMETCQQSGATGVEILISSSTAVNQAPIVVQFPCTDGSGSTTKIPAGTWTANFILTKDNASTVMSQGTVTNFVIPACGTKDVGTVKFNVLAPSTGTAGASGGSGGSGGAGGRGGSTGTAGSTGAAGFTGGMGPCDAKPLLLMHSCTVAMACHDASGSAAGFDMVTPGWETKMVGRLPNKALGSVGLRSQCDPIGGAYLVKGTPAKGLFIDKLKNTTQACGSEMPLITNYLSPAEMDCVQRWANGLTK